MFNFAEAIRELHDYSRHFPRLLTGDELEQLSQREFIRYCREQLWDRVAQETLGKSFNECNELEKCDVDLRALIMIAKAMEGTRNDDTV
jgi:hypothetical protein